MRAVVLVDPVAFTLDLTLDGAPVRVAAEPGESLLTVLRERLAVTSVKDGCAPQGQCGCCTVLVDGQPRVACVTAAERVAGRSVTTVDGLDGAVRDRLVGAFVDCGASQCGFCTPGILVRLAPLVAASTPGGDPPTRLALDRALAAHLCRCTGWHPILRAAASAPDALLTRTDRAWAAQHERATLEGGTDQRVGAEIVLGRAGFADDAAPRDALVAVPYRGAPDGAAQPDVVEAAGVRYVVRETLAAARAASGAVPGRRTTLSVTPPLTPVSAPPGGVALTTNWVEPAYLEPDASWCAPGGPPASPLANGGAFGAKRDSPVGAAAAELAARWARPVRVVWSREDVVALGPKRPPVSLTAVYDPIVGTVTIEGVRCSGANGAHEQRIRVEDRSVVRAVGNGPRVAMMRAPWAEDAVLVEGALHVAGVDRGALVRDDLEASVLADLAIVVASPDGARAAARTTLDLATGAIRSVDVRLAAGDPLDETVLRSYAYGAVHQALGWVLSEGLAVDPATGEIHDRTIRSFGILRARDVPPTTIAIVDDARPPVPRASDAVFAAVAASTWIALGCPPVWPALDTPTSRRLRRS